MHSGPFLSSQTVTLGCTPVVFVPCMYIIVILHLTGDILDIC